jgi:hypothetical protein
VSLQIKDLSLDKVVEVEEREERRAKAILALRSKSRRIVRVARKSKTRLGDRANVFLSALTLKYGEN